MKKRPSKLFFEDLLEAMERVESYISGLDKEDFLENPMVVDAVARNLEIIGEAARNISTDLRNKHPEIPWKRMVGLRNITIHKYFTLDLDIIWEIISRNLPETKPLIEDAYKKLEEK